MFKKSFNFIFALLVLFGLALVLPWRWVNWGSLALHPSRSVMVVGTATSFQANQVAQFYAGAEAVGREKQQVVGEVNKQVAEVLEQLKAFGIADADIQTSNVSVYQDTYSDSNRLGEWRASNSITINLREVEQAAALSELLTASGLTNISGPSFSLDAESQIKPELIATAVANARERAEIIAKENGFRLGKVLTIREGLVEGEPVYRALEAGLGGGSGPAVMPGQSMMTATVTVSFEIR